MALEKGAEPEKVASGQFRIDRRRALELLGRFQLPSPLLFPLPWVRAAVACGAEKIEATDGPDGFELRFFERRPYVPEELACVLDSLPAEQADPRVRELARGCLSALAASKGSSISVRSGPARARHGLTLTAVEDACAPVEEAEARTVMEVRWGPGGRPEGFGEALKTLRRSCRPRLLRFAGEDATVGGLPGGGWEAFSSDGLEGWLAEGVRGREARIFPLKLGVACRPFDAWLEGPQAWVLVDDPALSLTVDQTSVAQDEAFERLLARLRPPVAAMAVRRLKELSNALPELGGWLRDPQAYALWKESFAPDRGDDGGVELAVQRAFALDAGSAAGRRQELRRWAPIVAWLRDSARRVLADERAARTPLERALWETPLYLTLDGLPVTVSELEGQRRRFSRLTVGERRFSGEPYFQPQVTVDSRREMLELLAGPLGDRLTL